MGLPSSMSTFACDIRLSGKVSTTNGYIIKIDLDRIVQWSEKWQSHSNIFSVVTHVEYRKCEIMLCVLSADGQPIKHRWRC